MHNNGAFGRRFGSKPQLGGEAVGCFAARHFEPRREHAAVGDAPNVECVDEDHLRVLRL